MTTEPISQESEQIEKCSFITIVGATNVGKSTLVNALVGSKVSIVTYKPQTTRIRIMGILTEPPTQLIFVDTPGIFTTNQPFEKNMLQEALTGMEEAEKILFMVDARKGICKNTKIAIQRLEKIAKRPNVKIIICINKVDLVKKTDLLALITKLQSLSTNIFMISALKKDGVEQLKQYLMDDAEEGMWLYPEDQTANITERLLASEITREKLFILMQQELPYSLMVKTEKFEERKKDIKLYQTIYIEKESQKTIIVGKRGANIKKIGEMSRHELAKMFGKKVHLFLFVKVRGNWKQKPDIWAEED